MKLLESKWRFEHNGIICIIYIHNETHHYYIYIENALSPFKSGVVDKGVFITADFAKSLLEKALK